MMDFEFLESELEAIAGALEPTAEQKEGAQRSQRAIRSALDTGNMAARITGDYLIGSYARHTAIAPLDDVDIMFVVEPAAWELSVWTGKPDPKKVLDTFARAIRLRYQQSEVAVQRRSVGLRLHHLDIDVVPAIPTGRENFVLIPDRLANEWILTAPKVHSLRVTEVNRARSGLFVPLVKLLKGWNSGLHRDVALKSFSIETMALRIFATTPFGSLLEGCLRFFDFLCGRFNETTTFQWSGDFGIELAWHSLGYRVNDVAGTGSNLFASLSGARRRGFLSESVEARNLLTKAQKARFEHTCAQYLEAVFR